MIQSSCIWSFYLLDECMKASEQRDNCQEPTPRLPALLLQGGVSRLTEQVQCTHLILGVTLNPTSLTTRLIYVPARLI